LVWTVDAEQNATHTDIEDGVSPFSEHIYSDPLPDYLHG